MAATLAVNNDQAAQAQGAAHRFAKDQLKAFVECVERLEEEKKAIADDIRDVYGEAKVNGTTSRRCAPWCACAGRTSTSARSRKRFWRPICTRSGCWCERKGVTMRKLMECPRCNEGDERPWGFNRCGLCECTFVVGRNGDTRIVPPDFLSQVERLKDIGSGSDDGGNIRSSFG